MFIRWKTIPGAAWVKLENNDLIGSEIGYIRYGQQVDDIAECLTWCLEHSACVGVTDFLTGCSRKNQIRFDVRLTHRNERNHYELYDGDEGKWQTSMNCESSDNS